MVIKKIKESASSHLQRIKTTTHSFKQEFKKQIVLAITAAFAFLIALVWRDYIISIIKTDQASLLSAIIVTAISVIGLMIVSKWASTEQ